MQIEKKGIYDILYDLYTIFNQRLRRKGNHALIVFYTISYCVDTIKSPI